MMYPPFLPVRTSDFILKMPQEECSEKSLVEVRNEAKLAFRPGLRRDTKASDELEHTRPDNAGLRDVDASRHEAGSCPASPAVIHSACPYYLVHCFPSDFNDPLGACGRVVHTFDLT